MTRGQHEARKAVLSAFLKALHAYYAGRFGEAARLFEAIAASDPPAAHYLERCRQLAAHPPEPWDGVWVMTSK